jgi:hypothetical protein
MAKKLKGSKYKCEECGVVVAVDEPCECEPCDLVCCGVPMVEVTSKAPAKRKSRSKK